MPDKLRLLIIEDNPAERALLEAELASCPEIEWRTAESLTEAQRAIDEEPVEVVLLDLQLPDARGLEGLAWLQRRNPALPIVVLSGFGADDLLIGSEALRLGAQDFLAKGRSRRAELRRVLQFACARKEREHAVLNGAVRCPLTGLPRPAVLEERFARCLARNQRNRAQVALLYVDIDGMSAFVASEGRDRADACLVAIVRRLLGALRRSDGTARADDAGFVVLLEGMKHKSDVYVIARKLLAQMREPFDNAGPAHFGLSIGVAFACGDVVDFQDQLAQAEAAMDEARSQGGNRYIATTDRALAAE